MRRAFFAFASAMVCACQDDATIGADAGAIADTGTLAHVDARGVGNADGSAATQAAKLPCAVKSVLEQHCVSCHAAGVPQFGAPVSLASWADFQAQSPRSQKSEFLTARDRIQATAVGMMPPSPQPALNDVERKTLLDWFNAGAPSSDAPCGVAPGGDAGSAPNDAGVPSDDAAVASSDCEVNFELRATDGAGGGFKVPLENDHYECFYFKANVDANTLATSLTPLLDDTRVLHHWLLFASSNENESPSGTHRLCDGIHPGAYIMAAWLPGTPALVLPNDVGMEMPSGPSAQFILENHYNNSARLTDSVDKSGVKVCGTKQPKSQHAAIHWLGSERITLAPNAMGSASATCTPAGADPIHILGVLPHMHRLGVHAKMTILRAGGAKEIMHDGAFQFENQAWYAKALVLQPGDRVSTTCDYNNTTSGLVSLGEKTSNEMCYMFTLAYPVGRMNTGGDYVNPVTGVPFVQGPNRCMR